MLLILVFPVTVRYKKGRSKHVILFIMPINKSVFLLTLTLIVLGSGKKHHF